MGNLRKNRRGLNPFRVELAKKMLELKAKLAEDIKKIKENENNNGCERAHGT